MGKAKRKSGEEGGGRREASEEGGKERGYEVGSGIECVGAGWEGKWREKRRREEEGKRKGGSGGDGWRKEQARGKRGEESYILSLVHAEESSRGTCGRQPDENERC